MKTAPQVLKPRKVKTLLLDIETSPNQVFVWRTGHEVNVSYDSIIKERAVICACWKWAGEKKVYRATWDKNQVDISVLKPLAAAVAEADVVIGHNVGRFDLPWIRTRCLFHKLPMLSDQKVVDTLTIARRLFAFNSNRLDYIARFLGIGCKLKTGFDLWRRIVLNKDAAALKRMVTYCANDVILLEKVWLRLSEMTAAPVHAGVLAGGDKWSCPSCGSDEVKVNKTKVTAGGGIKHGMNCNKCGHYHTIGAPAYTAYAKAKGLVTT